jgi:hypothetical protein
MIGVVVKDVLMRLSFPRKCRRSCAKVPRRLGYLRRADFLRFSERVGSFDNNKTERWRF